MCSRFDCPKKNFPLLRNFYSLEKADLNDDEEIYKSLQENFILKLLKLDCLDKKKLLYITLPFYSARIGDEGSWIPKIPLWINTEKISYIDYAIFLYIVYNYLKNFGLTNYIYDRQQNKLPRYLKIEFLKDEKEKGMKLNITFEQNENSLINKIYVTNFSIDLNIEQYIKGISDDIDKDKEYFNNKEHFYIINSLLEENLIKKNSKLIWDAIQNNKEEISVNVNNVNVESEKYTKLIWFLLISRNVFRNLKEIYFIPSKTHYYSGREIGSGGPIFAFDKDSQINENCLECFWLSTSLKLREYSIFDWELKAIDETRKKGIGMATAAIMSRNMSHNLGSHVLSFIKNRLTSTKKMILSGVFEDLLLKNSIGNYSFSLNQYVVKKDSGIFEVENSSIEKQPHAKFLIGLGKILNYLQERQDFIATVTSGAIPYFSEVNFKDFIFDEINFDLKAERHRSNHELSYNLLLEYIAKSEGYSRDSIKICFEGYDGKNSSNEEKLNKMRSIEIDLPGGIIGRQAIFSILENLIRNSAKHGGRKKDKDLVINLSINDYSNDYYELQINDNLGNAEVNKNGVLVDNVSILQKYLREKIIDEKNGKLVETNKGLKEIRISAAWLRRINITDLENNSHFPKIVRIQKDNYNNLVFKLYLSKPKKAAIICDYPDEKIKKLNEITELRNAGFKFFSPNAYIEERDVSYKFVIAQESLDKEKLREIQRKSKVRFLEDKIPNEIKNINVYFLQIYKKWLSKIFNIESIPRIIIDDSEHKSEYEENIKDKSNILLFNEDINVNNAILFRVHNDEDNEFKEFKKKNKELFDKLLFLEGISGGNSTDRLVRHETKDELWTLRIIESAITKVLIIDERIWSRITGVEDVGDNIELVIDKNNIKYEMYKKKNIEVLNFIKKNIVSSYRDLYLAIKSNSYEKAKVLLKETSFDNFDIKVAVNNFLKKGKFLGALQLIEKLDPNVVKERSEYFEIVNLQGKKIGYIHGENSEINISVDNEYNLEYNFISIHQGILDKLYDTFFLNKEYKREKDSSINLGAELKGLSIDDFFSKFKSKFISEQRFLVHSGRSKPPYLPSNVAFIQYSSLENAFFDCKYSLTELLYSSIAEEV